MSLPDYLRCELGAVFCGTAVGNRSFECGHYYAGRGNKFWRVLRDTGLIPVQLDPCRDAEILNYGLGLTDLVKTHHGSDRSLPKGMLDPEGLAAKITRYQPRFLAFNGKTAAEAYLGNKLDYELQNHSIGRTRIFVLPSTSGAAGRYWDFGIWQRFAMLVRGEL